MTGYAQGTTVSSEKSRAEIERTLRRFGAAEFVNGWNREQATLAFQIRNLRVMFRLPLPNPADERFTRTAHASPRRRTPKAAHEAWEQATRERWRALGLIIKAKLVAVESGVVTFEQEFGMHVLMPDGRTVGDHVIPNLTEISASGEVPSLLPGPSKGADRG